MTVTETILKILSARYGVEITTEEETNSTGSQSQMLAETLLYLFKE
jgi:hypothetical protein